MKFFAFFLCLVLFCSVHTISKKEWTKLILTHHWPQTFCSMERCTTNFSYWTIHGLWPGGGSDCNSSWTFNASLIEDLIPQMKVFWPDLLKPASTQFWKHEWVKHGTCAAKAEALNSQHKYFSKALELYHKLDLSGVLNKSKIFPSEEPYKLQDIEGIIFSSFGVTPKIQCIYNKKLQTAVLRMIPHLIYGGSCGGADKMDSECRNWALYLIKRSNGDSQTLGQIEICFDRQFELIDCEKKLKEPENLSNHSGFIVCDDSLPVYYPPVEGRLQVPKFL